MHTVSPMPLQAVLEKESIVAALHELLPLAIRFDRARRLTLGVPQAIEMVDGVGVRLACTASVRWSIAGIALSIDLHRLQVILRPRVCRDESGALGLAFDLRVEDADLSGVPAFVDRSLVDIVNAELRARPTLLTWHLGRSLSHRFEIPPVLDPIDAIDLEAHDASVMVDRDAIRLVIDFYLTVIREKAKASGTASSRRPHP